MVPDMKQEKGRKCFSSGRGDVEMSVHCLSFISVNNPNRLSCLNFLNAIFCLLHESGEESENFQILSCFYYCGIHCIPNITVYILVP